MMNTMYCGWAEADITPEGKVELSGQYYQRVSTGIHLPLKAVCLVLEKGGVSAVMVSLDLVGLDRDFNREVQEAVGRIPEGPKPSRVFLNAIHSHSAPGLRLRRNWWPRDAEALNEDDYRIFVRDRVVGAIRTAWENRQPSGIIRAFSHARLGHCRHAMYADGTSEMYGDTGRDDFIGMESGEDSGVELLFTVNKEGRPTGAVVNAACTAQVMEATYRISSDFVGVARNILRERFGGSFNVLYQASAAGCQAPRDLTRNYKQDEPDFWHGDGAEEAGRRLSAAVISGYESAKDRVVYDDIPFYADVRTIRLPRRRVSDDEYRATETELSMLEKKLPLEDAYREFCSEIKKNEAIPGRPGPYDSKLHHFVLIQNARAVIARYHDQTARPGYEMDLHAVRVGDAVFVTNPFELYLEYGQRIKAVSQAPQTFIVQLATDMGGYLPTERAEGRGAYGALVINGQCDHEGGRMLVEETLASITDLFE